MHAYTLSMQAFSKSIMQALHSSCVTFNVKYLFSSQCYLQSFVGVCMSVSGSPLSESARSKLTKEKLGAFSSFFVSGSLQADVLSWCLHVLCHWYCFVAMCEIKFYLMYLGYYSMFVYILIFHLYHYNISFKALGLLVAMPFYTSPIMWAWEVLPSIKVFSNLWLF